MDKSVCHSCIYCGKTHRYASELRQHLRFHEDDRRFPCTHKGCGKIFFTNSGRQAHEYGHLPMEDRPFKCDKCAHCFSTNQHLTDHKRIHSNERPYECVVLGCGKSFAQQANYNMHVRRLHSDARPVKCSMCPYTCVVNRDLVKHAKKNHPIPPADKRSGVVILESDMLLPQEDV
jgi:KRAB domain-containing zinc finger protein